MAIMATPTPPVNELRRLAATALDVAAGPLSFFGVLYSASMLGSMANSWNTHSFLIMGISSLLPGALWLALLCTLAWRGQTLGQAVLGLVWADRSGACARWRPIGEPQFWCAAFSGVVLGGFPLVLLISSIWAWTQWHFRHMSTGMPGTDAILPISIAVIAAIVAVAWSARRRPACLVRLAR